MAISYTYKIKPFWICLGTIRSNILADSEASLSKPLFFVTQTLSFCLKYNTINAYGHAFESVCVSAVRFAEMGQRVIYGIYEEEDNMLSSCSAQRFKLTRKWKSIAYSRQEILIHIPRIGDCTQLC